MIALFVALGSQLVKLEGKGVHDRVKLCSLRKS